MHYTFSAERPNSRYIDIEFTTSNPDGGEVLLQLPSWRPGRYELGNFARNIQRFHVFDAAGESLPFKKLTKDSWLVHANGAESLTVRYNYYAAQPDAGACWVDEEFFYINPVHCCLYVPGRLHESCSLEFRLPENYRYATSLKSTGKAGFVADDFDELVDSPVLASASLQHQHYDVNGCRFHVWIQGECHPDWKRLLADFRKFTEVQVKTMVDFPFTEYHFLVLALPYKFYHGVEHLRSTVLAIGPGSELMQPSVYTDFLGVASHELFHAWNVKTIRPVELMPYDYTTENYSRLGFVYEGVTTYYGDLFLVRCGSYDVGQYFKEIDLRLQRHFDNYGRFHTPVADASFDTWLDGYGPGIPHRKTSIYDEGSILALMADLFIRRSTGGKRSLDDVMRALYVDFGKRGIGYSERDYMSLLELTADAPMTDFFMDYVYGTENYEPLLRELLDAHGCELHRSPALTVAERDFGFRIYADTTVTRVSAVAPLSIADRSGIAKEDELIAVNGQKIEVNLESLLAEAGNKTELTLFSPMRRQREITLQKGNEQYYHRYNIRRKEDTSLDSELLFRAWTQRSFRDA